VGWGTAVVPGAWAPPPGDDEEEKDREISGCTKVVQFEFKTHPGRDPNRSINSEYVIIKEISALEKNQQPLIVQLDVFTG